MTAIRISKIRCKRTLKACLGVLIAMLFFGGFVLAHPAEEIDGPVSEQGEATAGTAATNGPELDDTGIADSEPPVIPEETPEETPEELPEEIPEEIPEVMAEEIAPLLLDGVYGLTVAKIEADAPLSGGSDETVIDLMAADSDTMGYFSYGTGNGDRKTAYPLSISARFPTGPRVTDKEIEVILPVALQWVSDGGSIANTTEYLVGGQNGIKASKPFSDPAYGANTTNLGRRYLIGSDAERAFKGDVGMITLEGLAVKRRQAVADQTFSDDSDNILTVAVRWKENGIEKEDTCTLRNFTLTEFYPGASSDFRFRYGYMQNLTNYNVIAGVQSARLEPAPTNMDLWFRSMSFDLKVSYGGSTADVDDIGLTFPDGNNRHQWELTPKGGGEYTVATTNRFHGGSNFGLYDMQIDLSGLQTGDTVTVETSNFKYDFYKDLTDQTSPFTTAGLPRYMGDITWTYTIVEPKENVIVYGVTGSTSGGVAKNYPPVNRGLYLFRIINTGDGQGGVIPAGSFSTPKRITIDMSPAAGICGVSPARMTLPAAQGHAVTEITYTLLDSPGAVHTITGLWTGDAQQQINLTLDDFPGLTETDWLNSITYNMGSFGAVQSGNCLLYGLWLKEDAYIDPASAATASGGGPKGSDRSRIHITLSQVDGTGQRLFDTEVYNWVANPIANMMDEGADIQINAGTALTFVGSKGLLSDVGDVVTAPVFYIRNPLGTAEIDASTIKVTQERGNIDITGLFDITDVTQSEGFDTQTYKAVPTTAALESGTTDIWMGKPAYVVENGTVEINPYFKLRVEWQVATEMWEPAGVYPKAQFFLIDSVDPNLTLAGWNSVAPDPESGLLGPGPNRKVTVRGYQSVIGAMESKRPDDPESDYAHSLDISDRESISFRAQLTNLSGQKVDEVTFILPIPKKGQDWGQYSDGAFPFSMDLAGPVTGSANTTGFTIRYGNVPPNGAGAAIEAYDGWEPYNSTKKDTYNCMMLTAVDLPSTVIGTPAQTIAANTFVFTSALTLPNDADIQDGMVNGWSTVLYTELSGSSSWTLGGHMAVRYVPGSGADATPSPPPVTPEPPPAPTPTPAPLQTPSPEPPRPPLPSPSPAPTPPPQQTPSASAPLPSLRPSPPASYPPSSPTPPDITTTPDESETVTVWSADDSLRAPTREEILQAIRQQGIPSVWLGDEEIPLSAGPFSNYVWALMNLLFCLAGAVLAAILTIRTCKRRNKREEETGDRNKRRMIFIVLSLLLGLLGVIVFLLTENTRLFMVLVDKWTLLGAVILILEFFSYWLSYKRDRKTV